MHHSACKATLLALGLLAAASAQAQTANRKTAIGLHANATQYRGDLGNAFWDWKTMPYSGGLDISRYIGKVLDFRLDLDYLRLRYPVDPGTFTGSGQRFRAQTYSAGLGFKIKAPVSDKFFLRPYVLIQPGFSWVLADHYTSPTAANSFTRFGTFTGQIGGGLDFHLGEGAILYVQAGQAYLQTGDDRLDGVDNNATTFWDKKDRYLQFSAGLRANLGKAQDTDGDGVPDKQDKCPDTPQGVKVDATGCPLDSDGDKVPDYLDKCPDTPAGTTVDANGCPTDRDGDGVPDYQDRCPDRPGLTSNKGCPEIPAEQKKILNEATKYINFDFNKATLKSSSYARLDQMMSILNKYPDYSLSIAGHTDSKGADDYNLRLSYERAAAARTYLLNHGISAERIEARGYGETKPIADNKTAAGQALNRRVDFDPYLMGETNAAEVKYGPAPTIAELQQQGQTSPVPVKKSAVRKTPAPQRNK